LRTAIGARPTGENYFNGLVGEIIVVHGDVTTATRQKIEGYLANKWNLTAG